MPFDLDAIRDDVAETEATYGAHAFRVRYRPSKYVDSFHERFTEAKGGEAVNLYLSELVESWDLTAGGLPVPLTAEGLAEVPMQVKLKVVQAVEADVLNPTTWAGTTRIAPSPTATSSSGTPPAAISAPTSGPSATPSGSA